MTEKRKALEKFITPKGTAVYPQLTKPDTKWKSEGEYSAKIRLSEEDAAPLLAKIEKIMEENFKEVKAGLLADKDPKTKGKSIAAAKALKMADVPYKRVVDAEGEETGELEFNIKMKASYINKEKEVVPMTPKLFNASTPPKPLPKGVQIWGGSIIKVAGEFNPFYTAKVGAGISLRLSAVQVIKLVSGSGGGDASSFGFGGEEGGFEAEGSEFNSESGEGTTEAPEGDEEF